jgi:hypothetical protein
LPEIPFLATGNKAVEPFLFRMSPRPGTHGKSHSSSQTRNKKPALTHLACAEREIDYQGDLFMENDKKSTPSDEDILASKIQVLAGKTKSDPNPDELEKLKKLIKKNVPFTLRSYFMAYLLREIISANNPKAKLKAAPQKRASQPQQRSQKTENQSAKKTTERVLPEGARTLYLNIGKMKRLYAKELSQLLQSELGITREDIYSIRIHDKYSFISMSEENCEKAIAKLNGTEIKGRTAAISYSNKE